MMIQRTLALLVLSLLAFTARADGLKALERFLRDVEGGQASFTQVVTSPTRAGETVGRSKTSTGTLRIFAPEPFPL